MRKIISLLWVLCTAGLAVAAENGSNTFEFINQDLQDIVYILSGNLNTPVICDSTVSGKGSFLYSYGDGTSLEDALTAFLKTNRLYLKKKNDLWTVSRILVEADKSTGKISLNVYDAGLSQILGKLSEETGFCIVFDSLPAAKIEIHTTTDNLVSLVNTLMWPYEDFQVFQEDNRIRIAKNPEKFSQGFSVYSADSDSFELNQNEETFSGKIKNQNCEKVIAALFEKTGFDYSSFLNGQQRITDLSFSERTFNQTLELILEQCGGEYVFQDGVWYIFQKKSVDLEQSKKENDWEWNKIVLKNCEASKLLPVLSAEFPELKFIQTGTYILNFRSNESTAEKILSLAKNLDVKDDYEIIRLKYIKTSKLLEQLPPGISRENIRDTGTENSIFFTGTEDVKKDFLEKLKEIDRPKKVIRYDLLILQYTNGTSLSWGISQGARSLKGKDRTCLAGELGSIMNVNFDLITHFGLLFSEKINAAVAENKASVFADTTLYGLEGEKISFKNTNTYRYRDITSTADKTCTSITREINSGLVLDIDGWVSGDGMITMDVKASVSKQGVDLSGNTGNPPPTSEKYITTKIRARNGEPVILSGLSQRDLSSSSQGVPGLSKIPVAGNLFKNSESDEEKTEMTIYLVPHIEEDILEEEMVDWKEKANSLLSERAK